MSYYRYPLSDIFIMQETNKEKHRTSLQEGRETLQKCKIVVFVYEIQGK